MHQRDAGLAREAGLYRLSAATRWITAASVALAGVFSSVMAHTLPGHAAGHPSPAVPASVAGAGVGAAGAGPQPPAEPPVATSVSPPQVASGGS